MTKIVMRLFRIKLTKHLKHVFPMSVANIKKFKHKTYVLKPFAFYLYQYNIFAFGQPSASHLVQNYYVLWRQLHILKGNQFSFNSLHLNAENYIIHDHAIWLYAGIAAALSFWGGGDNYYFWPKLWLVLFVKMPLAKQKATDRHTQQYHFWTCSQLFRFHSRRPQKYNEKWAPHIQDICRYHSCNYYKKIKFPFKRNGLPYCEARL